jgi:hypothetical protein
MNLVTYMYRYIRIIRMYPINPQLIITFGLNIKENLFFKYIK